MTNKKIEIVLDNEEYSSLVRMAVNDLRSPPEQMRHILRLEIARRRSGLADGGEKDDVEKLELKEMKK